MDVASNARIGPENRSIIRDNRWIRERLSMEVALRMIGFEARTNTIRICTGLTEDRVRKLCKSYLPPLSHGAALVRRRGKSPQDIGTLLRNANTREQAALLAGTFTTLGLLSNPHGGKWQIDCFLGARLCDAYEAYLQLCTPHPLSFEHAWFLWQTLTGSSELLLATCKDCQALTLRDRYAVRTPDCPWCGNRPAKSGHDRVPKRK